MYIKGKEQMTMLLSTAILLLTRHAYALQWNDFPEVQKEADIFEMPVGLVNATGTRFSSKVGQFLHESRIGRFPIFTIDTKIPDEETPAWGAPMNGKINNIGGGLEWKGMTSKTCAIRDKAKQLMQQGVITPVIFIDGGDVLYGGCGESELSSRYRAITESCGGQRLIFGAEFGFYPYSFMPEGVTKGYTNFHQRLQSVLNATKLSQSSYVRFINCREQGDGPCSQPPIYQYLNSGFVMGPPKLMHLAYEFACSEVQRSNEANSEQLYLHEFLISNNHTTCLDYSSNLVLNLHQFDITSSQQVFSAEVPGTLYNKVTQQTQCFVHGNGNGKEMVSTIAKLVTDVPGTWSIVSPS